MSKFLRYSGIIQPIAIQDAIREKTIQIESYDFLKRMEQYPAALVSEAFGSFFSIPGVDLKAYVEGPNRPATGVREFSFKFPATKTKLKSRRGSVAEEGEAGSRGLPEVSVINVSEDTTDGIHVLKYRSYGWFQWDQGPWVRKDLGDESTITAWDDSTIECSFAGFTQDDNIEVFLIIGQSVIKRGGIEIIFDSGTPVYLGAPFTFIIREDAGGTLYDISQSCMVEKTDSETALGVSTDILYISAIEKFRGITFEFDEYLTGATLTFEYSQGSFAVWGDLSGYMTDGTSDFSQDGTITIDPPFNWTKAGQKVGEDGGDDIVVERFWLRITVSAWGSGTAKIGYLTRRHLAVGQDGDAIEIGIDFDQIEETGDDAITESVIIRPSDSDSSVFVPATWKKNLPIELLLGSGSGNDPSDSLLAATGFSSTCRDVEQLSYTTSRPQFTVWGIPPYPAYPGEARCLCGGEDLGSAGREILIGIGKEVWKVTEHTGFEFVFKLRAYYSTSLSKPFDVEIRRLNYKSDENAVYGMAWKRYDNVAYRPVTNVQADAKKGRCTPAIVFRYDFDTDTLQQQVVGVPEEEWKTAESRFLSGEVFHRNGKGHSGIFPLQWPWWEVGGTPQHEITGGEMIAVPEPGHYSSIMYPIFVGEVGRHVSLRRATELIETHTLSWGDEYDIERFLYGDLLPGEDEFAHGRFALASPGFYYSVRWAGAEYASTIDDVHVRFTFGQPGVVVWNPYYGSYIYQDFDSTQVLAQQNYIAEADYHAPPPPYWNFDRYFNLWIQDRQICCGVLKETGTPAAPELIWGEMVWNDTNVAYVPQKSDSGVYRRDIRTGIGATLFDSTLSSVSGSMSGLEETCTPLDLGYDPDLDVVHLTFFDRNTFRYHYAVIDASSPYAAYSVQTGSNFNFDWFRPIKYFAYHDGKMYAVCTDDRFQSEDAFLIEVTWSSPNITIRKIGVLRPGDYSAESLVWVGDVLYGISKPSGTMWSYGTSWVPRIQLADFGDKNCRAAATDLCQAANAILRVDPDRVAVVQKRSTVPGSSETLEDELVEVKPETAWRFVYDGCAVSWEFEGQKGTGSWGLTGRNQRILKISNSLVQDNHFAEKLAEIYGKYFFKERSLLPITAKFLPQFEREDLLKIIAKGVDPAKERSIVSIRLRNSNGQTEMGLVEQ